MGECPRCGSSEFSKRQIYPFRADYYKCKCDSCGKIWNATIKKDRAGLSRGKGKTSDPLIPEPSSV